MKQFVAVMRDPMVTMRTTCVIFGNTVTSTCLGMGAPGIAAGATLNMCMLNKPVDFTPIPPQHLSISGTLTVWIASFFYTISLRIESNHLFRRPTPSWRLGAGKCGKV
ncbi:hypothetical protein KIN20_014284 [Parelaphostrongylus tenuis]|uniref:Uncharacterized protein n=1 Tax=Parelaphostrongylus tenuis TaxID=148309 RepID=A0AAD5MZ99_PARTN|nr:hypothetical protein KIN20_014284 [Parelaphostrongylus tenuis]